MKKITIWLGKKILTLLKKIFPSIDEDVVDIIALLYGVIMYFLMITSIAVPLYFTFSIKKGGDTTININVINIQRIETIEKKMEDNNHDFYESKLIPPIFDASDTDIEGRYYVIEINDGDPKKQFQFETGKYVTDVLKREFYNSVEEFRKDLRRLDTLECKYKIYVKGSADRLGAENFRGELVSGYGEAQGFTHIKCCKKKELNKFSYKEFVENHIIGNTFINDDLPFLRAKFMQDALHEMRLESILLEGKVDPKVDPELRNVTLYICVNWEGGKNKWESNDNNPK